MAPLEGLPEAIQHDANSRDPARELQHRDRRAFGHDVERVESCYQCLDPESCFRTPDRLLIRHQCAPAAAARFQLRLGRNSGTLTKRCK